MKLGSVLRKLMNKNNLTAKSLGEAVGVKEGTIKTWLRNSNPRNLDQVRDVSKFFGVSLEFLLWGEDGSDPKSFEELPIEHVFSGWLRVTVDRAIPDARKNGDVKPPFKE